MCGRNESAPQGTGYVMHGEMIWFGNAATPALALTAAALRARLAQMGDDA
jgi:hypothetical protein